MKKSLNSKFYQYIFLLLIQFMFINVYSQIGTGLIWRCNTMQPNLKTYSSSTLLSTATVFDTNPKIVNIFVHIVNRDNGTGGLTNAQIDNWLSLLCNDYLVRNISIRVIGRTNLNSTAYFTNVTDANFLSLVTTDTHSDAIDIYFL